MMRMWLLLTTAFCVAALAEAQTVIAPPLMQLDTLRISNAIRVLQAYKETGAPETQFTCYIKQGWTSKIDTTTMVFSVDSVIGRGFAREMLVSRTVKDTGVSAWWLRQNRDTTGWVWDTLGHWLRPYKYEFDTVKYLGNANRMSWWLKQQWADSGAAWWTMMVPKGTRKQLYYELRLWKVLGDPAKNNGFNQQGMFRVRYMLKLNSAIMDSATTAHNTDVIK